MTDLEIEAIAACFNERDRVIGEHSHELVWAPGLDMPATVIPAWVVPSPQMRMALRDSNDWHYGGYLPAGRWKEVGRDPLGS